MIHEETVEYRKKRKASYDIHDCRMQGDAYKMHQGEYSYFPL